MRLGQLCTGADFWLTVASSLLRILLGFLLGVLFGTALAGLCWRFRLIDALARPLLGVLKSTPVASFIILALVWVKTTWLATVISFIMVLPLIYANVREGIDSADRQLLEMAQVFRLSRRKTFRYCYLPAILPFFLSAVSSALGFAWKSGIAAEVLGRPARADRQPDLRLENLPGNARPVCLDAGGHPAVGAAGAPCRALCQMGGGKRSMRVRL